MERIGGGDVPRIAFDNDFFSWWEQQIIAVDDYLYANLDFWGDPNLALLPSAAWGDIGNKYFLFYDFYEFYDFSNMKMNLKFFLDWIQMTNLMIIFQILGQYDQMVSHSMDIVAEMLKRRLLI